MSLVFIQVWKLFIATQFTWRVSGWFFTYYFQLPLRLNEWNEMILNLSNFHSIRQIPFKVFHPIRTTWFKIWAISKGFMSNGRRREMVYVWLFYCQANGYDPLSLHYLQLTRGVIRKAINIRNDWVRSDWLNWKEERWLGFWERVSFHGDEMCSGR